MICHCLNDGEAVALIALIFVCALVLLALLWR